MSVSSQTVVLSAGVSSKVGITNNDPKFAMSEINVGSLAKGFLAAQPWANGTGGYEGVTYIATATAGNWTINNVERYHSAAWVSTAPVTGQTVWVENLGKNYVWSGTAWVASASMKIASSTFLMTAGVSSTAANRSREGHNTGGYDKHFSVY